MKVKAVYPEFCIFLCLHMKEQLKHLIEHLDLNQKKFGQSIGLSAQAISEIMNDRSKGLSSATLIKIKSKYGVNLNWLLTGEGEIFLKEDTQPGSQEEARLLTLIRGREDLKPLLAKVLKGDRELSEFAALFLKVPKSQRAKVNQILKIFWKE